MFGFRVFPVPQRVVAGLDVDREEIVVGHRVERGLAVDHGCPVAIKLIIVRSCVGFVLDEQDVAPIDTSQHVDSVLLRANFRADLVTQRDR